MQMVAGRYDQIYLEPNTRFEIAREEGLRLVEKHNGEIVKPNDTGGEDIDMPIATLNGSSVKIRRATFDCMSRKTIRGSVALPQMRR
jgi:hypothetical protein